MNELMIALAKLAGAGVDYLNALKTESTARVAREDAWQAHRFEVDGKSPKVTVPACPGTPETAAPKKAPKVAKVAKMEAAATATPAEPPAAPAQPPAPAVDPLGDTGSVAPAFEGAANPPTPEEPKAAVEAPKELTETESYEKLIKTMGALLQLHKSDADGGEAAKANFRAVLTENFKVAKIKDLTHPQRIQATALFEALIAGKK